MTKLALYESGFTLKDDFGFILATADEDPPIQGGLFRFLKDHYHNGEYIFAGEIREMSSLWNPTADVEPLDYYGVTAFYAAGPKLGGVWRTIRTDTPIYAPVTYWKGIAPNVWALTGLGASLSPITAVLTRIEDKEV